MKLPSTKIAALAIYCKISKRPLLSLFSQGLCLNTLWKNYDLSICISQTRFKHLIPNSCKMIAILHGFLNIFLKHLLEKRFTSSAASIRFQIQLYFFFLSFYQGTLFGEGTVYTSWILLCNDSKSRHRRIKKQHRYESLTFHKPVICVACWEIYAARAGRVGLMTHLKITGWVLSICHHWVKIGCPFHIILHEDKVTYDI